MYRLVNRQLSSAATQLAAARKDDKTTGADICKLTGTGFFGISALLIRKLPELFIDFFVMKNSMTLVDSTLIEALRENGNFIVMLLVWLGVDEERASALRDEILASRNVSQICFENEPDDRTASVTWVYTKDDVKLTRAPQQFYMPFMLKQADRNETVFNFALDNPFDIFAAVVKAAHNKTAVTIGLPRFMQTRFIEESFYRMFFWLLNATARLTQDLNGEPLPDNLGAFYAQYFDYNVSRSLSQLAPKANNAGILLTFDTDMAVCTMGNYFKPYVVANGRCMLTSKAVEKIVVMYDNDSNESSRIKVIHNYEEAEAFDKSMMDKASTFDVQSEARQACTSHLGFPLVVATDREITRDNETGLIIYNNVFYDAKTGTGIAAMKVPTRFPATGEDGVMRFDVSASPWLAYKSNEPTMLILEASLRMIKNGEKKCVIERSDGEPFSIHGSFLPMLTRALTKGKRSEGLNSQLKSTVRYQLSGAALKSVTIDMSHAQPLQTMTVVLA